jgi:hypothetical protein
VSSERLLPSEQAWVQTVADRLLDGDRLLVRGLPRTGKTLLARAVADLLGETAFYFDGATVTEVNQAEQHARLQAELDSRVNSHDCAQLVFDGYGRAVRRSRGAILHSQLYGQLIDGDRSRDIGAIFTSRYADALDIKVSGSPLLGRVTSFELPRLTEEDAATLGVDLDMARAYFGDSTTLAHIALNAEPLGAPDGVVDFVSINAASLSRDLPTGAVQVLVGARSFADVDSTSRRALRSLGSDLGGSYTVASSVAESRLVAELQARNHRWPTTEEASVARFCELLADATNALWVDRYIYERPELLANFLASIRRSTVTPVRLLGKPTNDHANIRTQIAAALGNVTDVEARVMAYQDVKPLHDRHLVDPSRGVGFVVPTADVILSQVDAGSAVVVEMPSIEFDYEACWNRATPLK